MTIAEKLSIIIKRLKLNDSEVAKAIPLSSRQFSNNMKNDAMTIEHVKNILSRYNIDLKEFENIDKEGIAEGNNNINIASETSGIVLQKNGSGGESVDLLRELIKQKDETINLLKEKIKRLEEELNKK